MQIDNTTLNDLSIFHKDEEYSIFHKLNFTQTAGGREWLARFFSEPLHDLNKIKEIQQILQCMSGHEKEWPGSITNGTIMVMDRFYESPIDTIPTTPHFLNAVSYKIIHNADFSLVRYSVGHFADFIKGFRELMALFDHEASPPLLRGYIQRGAQLLNHDILIRLAAIRRDITLTATQTIYFGHYILYCFRHAAQELIEIFGRLDAWHSMARAVNLLGLSYPQFITAQEGSLRASALYHVLLPAPVAYDVSLQHQQNFLFLTGANMAGKSTFIKSVGAAVYLAHLGMGVPAADMQLTLFDGILSNINVEDNIVKGESYFFNEVQRIKNTITKINNGKKWLVLIDELFKGTNVQDAMKCSGAVIKGLIRIPHSLFILSTHLYEIAEDLKTHSNIIFRYFETEVRDEQLLFSYQLQEGVSNDRIGYLILKQEKVVEMLEKL